MGLRTNIVSIVQARMGSSRLPGKILKPIQGKPMLWHIVNRLKRVNEINKIIIATSNLSSDDLVYDMAITHGIDCFRGSENDVLNRYFHAAHLYNAHHIVRITGDCPLVDRNTISNLIAYYFSGKFDFCGVACGAGVAKKDNINRFPDGLDAEIFSLKVLEEAHLEATSKLHREHVTPFIWQNDVRYKLGSLYSKRDYSNIRLTVDNAEDYEMISWIYDTLFPMNPGFGLKEILNLIKHNIDKIQNNHLVGQEGYDEFWN